jgi:inosine/xanthosine triphosphatase
MASAAPERIVAVGSTNRVKVNAAQVAFVEAFGADAGFVFKGVSALSGVSDQPMGDEETRKGAIGRAYAAAKLVPEAEFAVGLEGGCVEEAFSVPRFSADAAAAEGEGRVVQTMQCMAWMVVLHVPTGKMGFARTGSFLLPDAVAELVRAGVELGVADDRVFDRTNSKQEDGAVGLLTKGLIDRTLYYKHALVLALVPFISAKYY